MLIYLANVQYKITDVGKVGVGGETNKGLMTRNWDKKKKKIIIQVVGFKRKLLNPLL